MTDQQPPQSKHTEQQVLGAILKKEDALTEVMGLLPNAAMFYSPRHQQIYEAALSLSEAGEPVDITTVADELTKCGKLQGCGGRSYLVELCELAVTTGNAEAHAKIVCDKSQYRKLIGVGQDLMGSGYSQGQPPETIIANLSQQLSSIVSLKKAKETRMIGSHTASVLNECSKITEGQELIGTSWGLSDLDHMTGGAQDGNLVIIAGLPGMGKTALASCIASNQAMNDIKVAVFSAETKDTEWVLRALCCEAKVDSMKLRRGAATSDDWDRLTHASNSFQKWAYHLNATPAINLNDLILQVTRMHRENGIDICYIDYLQKLTVPGDFESERLRWASAVSRLKRLAQELDIPVVLLSQINREVERRQNKRPMLSDVKETGQIDQDCDLALGLYRPSLYVKKKSKGQAADKKLCECIIMKQRNGPTGTVDLHFDQVFTRFEDMSVAQEPLPF